MKPSIATFSYKSNLCDINEASSTEGADKYRAAFEALCLTYGLNITNILCLVNAWCCVLSPKTDHINQVDREKFWGIDRDFSSWQQNYYHILIGAIKGYKLYLEKQRVSPKFSWLATLDYTKEMTSDTFRDLLSAEVRTIVDRDGGDYYEVLNQLRPELIKAILEYEGCERKGFAVYDGKRRYALIEMFLNTEQHCPPRFEAKILGIKPEERTAVLNNDVLTFLF